MSDNFPKKPKSEKISLVSSLAFGGWMIVRDVVLDLFGSSKDPQYLMLVNLLDEITCFNTVLLHRILSWWKL